MLPDKEPICEGFRAFDRCYHMRTVSEERVASGKNHSTDKEAETLKVK